MGTTKTKRRTITAKLTLRRPGKMTPDERLEVCHWLLAEAQNLEREGEDYPTTTYTALLGKP